MAAAGAEAEEFFTRVMERFPNMKRDKYSAETWRHDGRPTSEGVGLKPGLDVDPEKVVKCILNVEAYPDNVQYVEQIDILNKKSAKDFTYVQKMKLPALGGVQCALHIFDLGERDGYRVVAWEQDDAETQKLDKNNGGARTDYNLGAWLVSPTEVAYALSAAPVKSDVGTLKYAVMTKGADATASTVLAANIDSMVAWAQKS